MGRDGENRVPDADDTPQYGDHVTFLGQIEAVREAVSWLHPSPRLTPHHSDRLPSPEGTVNVIPCHMITLM
ncbi:hypothetical protein [Halalkalicoccus ordinarius]|uniref:hypothetical protein n=1 Tax=Halalkalicoccus ordinarius TaxID=3116651 RepID=UPI00300ED52B